MVVDLVPFAGQAQTEFLVLSICDEKDPLVEAIEVVASSGLVEVPDDRSDRRVDLCVVGRLSGAHRGCLQQHASDVCIVVSVSLEGGENCVGVFAVSIKGLAVLDPMPSVDRERTLELHEALGLDGRWMNSTGGLENLVTPCVLPTVEVSRSGIHVVDLDRVQMIIRDESVAVVSGSSSGNRIPDAVACHDFLVDCKSDWVATIIVDSCGVEVASNEVEVWARR